MTRRVHIPTPDSHDLDAQEQCFRNNSFVVIPDLLSPDLVQEMNDAMDRDMRTNPFMWWTTGSRDYNCNLLLNEPVFEQAIRPPQLIALLERLMGGPYCFEELAVRHRSGEEKAVSTDWHRDCTYWHEHPLRLDYPQIIYYLTDVDESTHCFSISPEPAAEETLEPKDHLERGGILDFHGKAGSGILFNAATLHGVTLRETNKVRRTIQVYYGHPVRPSLSEVTLMPPRLWRDHDDPEVRRFYGKFNHFSHLVLSGLGILDSEIT